jgi:hypothetical protein
MDHGKGQCITTSLLAMFFEIVAAETSPGMNYSLLLVNPRTINSVGFILHVLSKAQQVTNSCTQGNINQFLKKLLVQVQQSLVVWFSVRGAN